MPTSKPRDVSEIVAAMEQLSGHIAYIEPLPAGWADASSFANALVFAAQPRPMDCSGFISTLLPEWPPRWFPRDVTWPFPTWSVRRRPFDWAEDAPELPPPAPRASWEMPIRRRMTITLRPPAAVVQR